MFSAAKIAKRYLERQANGKKTGYRDSVGLFIPLPADLAKQFPSLGPEDRSPPHTTFLFVGDVSEDREADFLKVLSEAFQGEGWPRVKATLDHLDYFQHADKGQIVPHVAVKFSQPMAELRDRVKSRLEEAGFEVGDSFPVYRPHVTLEYVPGFEKPYKGDVPTGTWEFGEMEVWGLPKVHKVNFAKAAALRPSHIPRRPKPRRGPKRSKRDREILYALRELQRRKYLPQKTEAEVRALSDKEFQAWKDKLEHSPTDAQVLFGERLLKQVETKNPPSRKKLQAMSIGEISTLIRELEKKRGRAVFYGDGTFSHWQKAAFVGESGWDDAGNHRVVFWPDNMGEEAFLNGPVRSLFEDQGYFTGRIHSDVQKEQGRPLGIEVHGELEQVRIAKEVALSLSEALEIVAAGLALLVAQGVVVTNAFFGPKEIQSYLRIRRRFHSLFAQAALQVADFFETEAHLRQVAMGLRMFANSNPQQFQRALVGAGRALRSIRRVNYPDIDPAVRTRMAMVFSHLRSIASLLGDKDIEWYDFRSHYEGLFQGLVKARKVPSQLRTLFRKLLKYQPTNLPEDANPGVWFDLKPEERVGIRSRVKDLQRQQEQIHETIEDPEERVKAYREVAQALADLQGEAGVNLKIIEGEDVEPLDTVLRREKKIDRDGPTEYVVSGFIDSLREAKEKYPDQFQRLTKGELRKLVTMLRKAKTFSTLERVIKEAVDRGLLQKYWIEDLSDKIAQTQKNKAIRSGLPLTPLAFEPKTVDEFREEHSAGDVVFRGAWSEEEKRDLLGRVSTALAQLESIFGKGFVGKHAKRLNFEFHEGADFLTRASYFGWDDRRRWQPRVAFGKDYEGVLAHELAHYFDDLIAYRIQKEQGLVPEYEYGDVGHGTGDVFGRTGISVEQWVKTAERGLEGEPTSAFNVAVKEVPEFVDLMRVVASLPDYQRWSDKLGRLDMFVAPAAAKILGENWRDDPEYKYLDDVRYRSEIPPEVLEEAIRLFTKMEQGDTRKLTYWNSSQEVWARLCEQYIYTRLSQAGIANPWLTRLTYDIDVEDAFVEDERFVEKIVPIMDRLFARLKERKVIARWMKEATERVARRWVEKIPGGLAEDKQPSDFDKKQLEKGVKVELEHTDDRDVAREIAMDHLTENPKYYDELEKIEKHARHSQSQCMHKGCKKPPEIECIWAEGMGRAWFCKPHFKEWSTEGAGKGEVCQQREITDGKVGEKYGDKAACHLCSGEEEVTAEDLVAEAARLLEVAQAGPVVDSSEWDEDVASFLKIAPPMMRVASLHLALSAHRRSIALMKFLSEVARSLGVAKHVYIVGGAVRNFVIERPIKDLDLVIDSISAGRDSEWFARELARRIPASTSLKTNQYGVAILTVSGDWDLEGENMKGETIEIANARSESYAKGEGKGYKPSEVQPATIEEDVYRREFTFNTLMWRLLDLAKGPDKAEIIDITGCGLKDLKERSLKCPADPNKTFSDDPTRMLRAIKFTGKYGFKIPPDVAASIKRNARKMKSMPWEAIGKILVEDILKEPTARKSLRQMKELGLLDVVSEMIQEKKPFATFMANQLTRNRKVQLLLDLMDLGLPANTPLHFLTPKQRQWLRETTVRMPEDEASKFADRLIKPPVDNNRVIDELMLPPPQRSRIKPLARELILTDPKLADDPNKLTDLVIKKWK